MPAVTAFAPQAWRPELGPGKKLGVTLWHLCGAEAGVFPGLAGSQSGVK